MVMCMAQAATIIERSAEALLVTLWQSLPVSAGAAGEAWSERNDQLKLTALKSRPKSRATAS